MASLGAKMLGVSSLTRTINGIVGRWMTSANGVVVAEESYSVYVEFGTYKMAAQPYMRPGAEHAARQVPSLARSANGIKDLVNKTLKVIEDYAKRVVPVDTGALRASIRAIPGGGGSGVSASF